MAFTFSKAALTGPKAVAPGIYEVSFGGFKPAYSKEANKNTGEKSLNLNFWGHLVGMKSEDGKDIPVYAGLNLLIPSWIQDFVHGFGIEMENQESDNPGFPGTFEADPATFNPDDPNTWKYAGPLVGQIAKWELGISTYQGRDSSKPRRFICSVPDCATRFLDIRHATDMLKKG